MAFSFKGLWKRVAKSAKRKTPDYYYHQTPISVSDNLSLKDYTKEDPDLAANIRRFIDNAVPQIPKLIVQEGSTVADSTVKSYMDQLLDVRFYKLIRKAVYDLLWNGNAFFEIKFNGKKLKEMYSIDPETIKIKKNAKDEVVYYEQEIPDGNSIRFSPDEIIHITIDHLDTGVRGHAFISSLKTALLRKDIAESYLQWVLQNNNLAPIINVKADNLSEEQWIRIIDQLNMNSKDPDYRQVIESAREDLIELIHLFNTSDFETIYKYIDKQKEQIITVMQVPPIISGTIDDSNRSNSEIQARLVFYNTIKAFQRLIEEELNYEMLRKLKWNNVQFKFENIDQRVDTDAVKLAKTFRELGYTREAVHNYLKQNGINIEEDFEEIPEMAEVPSLDSSENSNEAPSREPRDKSGLVKNEAQRLEDRQLGVSSDAN